MQFLSLSEQLTRISQCLFIFNLKKYNIIWSFKVQTDGQQMCQPKETVDENGKFSYHTSDMRPVPPGKYKTK